MNTIDQLIRAAFNGDSKASKTLYFRTQLMPELEEVLSEVFEAKPLIVMQPEQDEFSAYDEADSFSALKWTIVERTVAKAIVEATEGSQPIVTVQDKLAATQELREGLEAMVAWLDARIDSFHDLIDEVEAGVQNAGVEAASA